jgi:fructokinase
VNGNGIKIAGLGEILWDMLPEGKQLGGAPANFAYHCQSLGAESYIVSSIGNDISGHEIINKLQNIGLSSEYIQKDNEHPTGTVDVKLDAQGKPEYVINENVAWDFIKKSDQILDLAAKCDAVCFGTLAQRSAVSQQTIQYFLNSTRKNCLRILDINLRQLYFNKDVIEQSLGLANCLKLNDEELPVVAKILNINGSNNKIVESLRFKYNLELIAVTKGDKGSNLYSSESDSKLKTPKIKVLDTVGAGDAFTAVLALGWLQNVPLEKIHSKATELAAFVCTKKGATPQYTPEFLLNKL